MSLYSCIDSTIGLIIGLYFRVKTLNSGGQLRPKQGPKFKVPLQHEKELVKFLDECSEQGDPRTEEEISSDIGHFLNCYKYDNKFKNKKPGLNVSSLYHALFERCFSSGNMNTLVAATSIHNFFF